jgi:F-type H+-transporting ATPase subunit b
MNLRRLAPVFACFSMVAALLLLTALPVLAQQAAENDPADSATGTLFRWLNFLLVFGGIGYAVARYGGNFFRANAKAIAASITEASAIKAESEAELRRIEAKLAGIDREVASLREAARRESADEADRVRLSGQGEIEKIRQAARVELAAAERAAQQQLRAAAAALAIDRAEALVTERMTPAIRARLVGNFVGELGRSAN